MKMKALAALCLAAAIALGIFTGCKNNSGGEDQNSQEPYSNTTITVPSGKLKDVRDAVKEVFGDNYLPQQLLDAQMLKDTYGVSEDMVKDFIAEVPLINVQIDTFVGVEAAEGKVEDVKKALDDYRLKLVLDETQYPANRQMAKALSLIHI